MLKEKLGLFVCRVTGLGLITLCARCLPWRKTTETLFSDPEIEKRSQENLLPFHQWRLDNAFFGVFLTRYYCSYFRCLQLMCHKEYFLKIKCICLLFGSKCLFSSCAQSQSYLCWRMSKLGRWCIARLLTPFSIYTKHLGPFIFSCLWKLLDILDIYTISVNWKPLNLGLTMSIVFRKFSCHGELELKLTNAQ